MTGNGKMLSKKKDTANSLWTNEKVISESWIDATSEDIGSGFRRVEIDPFAERPKSNSSPFVRDPSKTAMPRTMARKLKKLKKRSKSGKITVQSVMQDSQNLIHKKEMSGERRHRFLNGNSQFVFYRLRVNVATLKNTPREISEINYKNKLDPRQRKKFTESLDKALIKQSNFYLEEVLPRTNALMSALQRVDELSLQMFDSKSDMPVEFIKNKTREAVQLRIIRHICETYELTNEERKLMINEYKIKRNPLTLI